MTPANRPPDMLLAKIFVGALIIRVSYDATLFLTMGDKGLLGVDSLDFLARARLLANSLLTGHIHGWDWLGRDPVTMPLYAWTTALTAAISQSLAPLTFVLLQAVLDSLSCLIIYFIAREFSDRIAAPAAIAAAINPTQIIMAGLYYSDTQFLFFTAIFLLGALRWLRSQQWRPALCIAIGFVGAALTRILVAPFGIALIVYMLLIIVIRRQFRWRILAQLAIITAIFVVPVGTLSLRNHAKYGSWSLTSQTGIHLAGWVAPLVKQAKDGTPWRKTYDVIQKRAHDRFGKLSENQFKRSQQYAEIAREELVQLGPAAAVKAWLYGAAINLGAPGLLLSPPILQRSHTGFYATPGTSMPNKIYNFLFRSDSRIYAQALFAGALGIFAVRIIQLIGVSRLLRDGHQAAGMILLVGWCAFILLVNGPVASPKYRLPIEPVLMVFTGAGLCTLRRRFMNEKP